MQTSSSETSTLTSKMRYTIGNYVCPLCYMVFENNYAFGDHQSSHRLTSSSSSVEDSDDALNIARKGVIDPKEYKACDFLKAKEKIKTNVAFKSKDTDSEATISDPIVKESMKVYDAGYDGDVEVTSKRFFEQHSSTNGLDLEFWLGLSDSDSIDD